MILSHNCRVRALVDDGCVTVGLIGTVTNTGQNTSLGAVQMIGVRWDNETTSKIALHAVEVLSPP